MSMILSEKTKKVEQEGIIPLLKSKKGELERAHGFKFVSCLDERDQHQIEILQGRDRLELHIIPIGFMVEDESEYIIKKMKTRGITSTKNLFPSYISATTVNHERGDTLIYLKDKNIVVTQVNPFYDEDVYELFKTELEAFEVSYFDAKQAILESIANKMNRVITDALKNKQNRQKECFTIMIDAEKRIAESIKEQKSLIDEVAMLEKQAKAGKQTIKEEIEKLNKNKLLEYVKLENDGIHIGMGEIYLHGRVQTGIQKNSSDIEVPVMELRKVYIGKMEVIIKESGIRVENLTQKVEGYPHPHATTSGQPCYGEQSNKIGMLRGEMKLLELIKALFSWIRSYNGESAYIKLQAFYDQEQREKQRQKSYLDDEFAEEGGEDDD